jgi:hypothetical protein
MEDATRSTTSSRCARRVIVELTRNRRAFFLRSTSHPAPLGQIPPRFIPSARLRTTSIQIGRNRANGEKLRATNRAGVVPGRRHRHPSRSNLADMWTETPELAAFRRKWLSPEMAGAFLLARIGERHPRVVCNFCHRLSSLSPTHVAGLFCAPKGALQAASASSHGRPVPVFWCCADCQRPIGAAFNKARALVRELFPRGGRLATLKQLGGAHAAVLVVGKELEEALRLRRGSRKAGRPQEVAGSFALAFLHLQGVSDAKLAKLLGRSPRYVKDRRERSLFHVKAWMREFEPAHVAA